MTHPGRSERGPGPAIARWAERRRAAGEFAARIPPRTITHGGVLELRAISAETVREVCALQVEPRQRGSVAPNAVSLAEASFSPEAWPRAIYVDDVPVGFAMLSIDAAAGDYGLWRFMIDARYQGRGYGRAAINRIAEHVRGLPGATHLLTSWVPGENGPEGFYLGLGFEPTGDIDEGEVVGRLPL